MNINYLYSIIDLYQKNEKDNKKAKLSLTKEEENIRFSFGMSDNKQEKTIFTLPIDTISEHINDIIKKYKGSLLVIEEKYEHDGDTDYCYYVKFNNGRVITFNHYTLIEINNLRNMLYNIEINKEEIRIPKEKTNNISSYQYHYNYNNLLLKTGFSSYKALIFTICVLMFVFIFSLLVFWVLAK